YIQWKNHVRKNHNVPDRKHGKVFWYLYYFVVEIHMASAMAGNYFAYLFYFSVCQARSLREKAQKRSGIY
ncbi:MAG: hypothetical protein KDD43_09520, partial [Bdellovibrionales bacterium]|nr:hypothetical protein [Bdellovibrionales bacterium]